MGELGATSDANQSQSGALTGTEFHRYFWSRQMPSFFCFASFCQEK